MERHRSDPLGVRICGPFSRCCNALRRDNRPAVVETSKTGRAARWCIETMLVATILVCPSALVSNGIGAVPGASPTVRSGQPLKVHSAGVAVSSKRAKGEIPDGYGPAELRKAYGLPSAAPRPQTIAIVTAFDDPSAERDLGVYSTTFSLPVCTTANGCFRKVNGLGQANSLPRVDSSWALETSLGVQVAHGVCPNCRILLVEATSDSLVDLLAAVDTAANLGANEISISWGVAEFSTESLYDFHFNRPGIAITASSGDSGYGVEWPAASPYVTAVGGTTLTLKTSGARAGEKAWKNGGSGCSAFEPKPNWQKDEGCPRRTVPDVAVVADPATGAAVYSSNSDSASGRWLEIGGTSLGAPLVAAIYALSGDADQVVASSHPYAHASALFDVLAGSNGDCSPDYLCTAGVGYDGPTGLGSPNGIAGF